MDDWDDLKVCHTPVPGSHDISWLSAEHGGPVPRLEQPALLCHLQWGLGRAILRLSSAVEVQQDPADGVITDCAQPHHLRAPGPR
jgi:hypothetical protein